jgi:hypothetical protein
LGTKYFDYNFPVTSKQKNVNQALTQFQIIDFSLVKNVAPSTVQQFRIVSLALKILPA